MESDAQRQKARRETELGAEHARRGIRPTDQSSAYTAGWLVELARLNVKYAEFGRSA